jgi:predicted metallopeptidase
MKTFFNILQRITKSNTIKYPGEVNQFIPLVLNGSIDMYTEYNVYSFISKIHKEFTNQVSSETTFIQKFANSKFKALNYILTNKYNTEKIIECVFNAFSKAQRIYFALIKFVNLYKLKKYSRVVTEDLSMTPLDINHKNTFVLIQSKSTYLFSLIDLIRIIETAIGHAPSFFADPLRPKNPFNNEEFTDATLYNIYFKMKDSGQIISTIFHLFFLSNFKNILFFINNEAFLREYSINKYVFKSPALCLYTSVIEMLKDNFYTKKLTIHANFPKELLVEIFRPFLYYYYIVNYDIQGTHKINKYKTILYLKLKKFYQYNKAFGRRIIKLTPEPFNFTMNMNQNVNLSNLLNTNTNTNTNTDTDTNTAKTKQRKRKFKSEVVFNSNHINFYNINIRDMSISVNEATSLLIYFSSNVAYYNDSTMDVDDDETLEEEEDDDDEESTVDSVIDDDATVEDDSTIENDNNSDNSYNSDNSDNNSEDNNENIVHHDLNVEYYDDDDGDEDEDEDVDSIS